jgi:hypothetical protein
MPRTVWRHPIASRVGVITSLVSLAKSVSSPPLAARLYSGVFLSLLVGYGPLAPPLKGALRGPLTGPDPVSLTVAEQGYLAPQDHGTGS